MDWKTYEEVTKSIYETLGRDVGVKIVGWGNSFKVKGKSGVDHQIDVLTSHSDGVHQYLTDIECKYWNETINKDTIMKVLGIVEDCNFNKGIVVSKLGFTPDAEAYARFKNVGLVILREPVVEDWEGRVKKIIFNLHICVPLLTKYFNESLEVFNDSIDGRQILADTYYYLFPDGTKKYISEFLQEFYRKLTIDKLEIEVEEKISLPEGTLLLDNSGIKYAQVKNILIAGRLTSREDRTEINAEDHIWMIMKSIFENKQFAITHEGEIRDVSE